MLPTLMSEAESQLRLEASTSGLADRVPLVSARRLFSKGQRNFLIGLLLVVVIGLVLSIRVTFTVILAIFTLTYLTAVVYRLVLFSRSMRSDAVQVVTDEEALSVPERDLPFYTIMIAAYHESAVIAKLIEHVGQLDYPVERLEVLLLIEEDDDETLEALRKIDAGSQFKLVVVPPGEPRTKPKALNYGLTLARGDIVAVFDVEDTPDILQLRRSAVALDRFGPEVACLQAKLSYGNADQNFITRSFTIEYAMWFSFLPGLVSLNAPIPLGGTSNHFRRSALRALGGWDPYNVTEDCDLGVRMFREGYRTKVLESITLEEANSDFVNWVKQRSRWYKGYLQTFLIHLRSPLELTKEMGGKGVFHLSAFVGATPILAVLNPVFWGLTVVWFIAHPTFVLEIFPAPVYYLGLALWSFGNFLLWYLTILTARHTEKDGLALAAVFVPLYWIMMSIAATKALLQLVMTPSFWEKTVHGLAPQGGPVVTALLPQTLEPPRDHVDDRRAIEMAPAQPSRRTGVAGRFEGRLTFWLTFIVYLVAAFLLAFKYHSFPEDAVSRMANGFYVLYSGDPHLAAIGFVWNPLQSVADDVVLIFNNLWPALASHDMAGSIVSVVSMAGAVYQLNAILREWKCPVPARAILTMGFAFNPMILYYGANGMSEGLYLFTLMATTRYLLRWIHGGDLRSLVYAAVSLGFCYLARNEAVGAAALATMLIFGVSYLRELWMTEVDNDFSRVRRRDRRARVEMAFTDALIFGLPTIVSAAAWAITSWIITGQPFAQFTSIYGNSSQEAFLGHKPLHARLSYEFHALGALAPTLIVVIIAALVVGFRRRNVASLVPIAVLGGALLFDVGGYLTNTIENFLRYFITSIPLCVLLVGSLFDRSENRIARNPKRPIRSRPQQWSKQAIGVAATLVSAILILPTLVTTADGMANPAVGVQEDSLLGVVFHKHLDANDRAVAATYPDIQAVSLYLGNLGLPDGSVVVDNFTTCVPDIITNIRQPKLFVIPNDRDFQRVLADPLTFHAHYILEADPKSAPVTAVNIAYPTLWATGAGFTKLQRELPAKGNCPEFRLFRVITHPSEASNTAH